MLENRKLSPKTPEMAPTEPLPQKVHKRLYLSVLAKFLIVITFSALWFVASLYISYPWILQLSQTFTAPVAWAVILGIALIPGTANAFLLGSLILDKRPIYHISRRLPAVSVLVAAYNEESYITDTLNSIVAHKYPGFVEILVIDDGSTDTTVATVNKFIEELGDKPELHIELIKQEKNAGKAKALNVGLKKSRHDIIVTVDADSYIYRGSLEKLVSNLVSGPENTGAVAGTVLVRNSRENFISKIQEWDYFHGISVVKRAQSLYQGTLVAQGAFSAYYKSAIEDVGGWMDTVGEDIVLTWKMHEKNYGIGYAENSFVFTNVPTTYGQFYQQRKRWARGLLEAFRHVHPVLVNGKLYTPFIILNIFFLFLDLVFLLAFIPGLIAAVFFQYYAVVGIMTLLVLPITMLINLIMFSKQNKIFKINGLKVRYNILGFIFYIFTYQIVMVPASLAGYFSELFGLNKQWGTKS